MAIRRDKFNNKPVSIRECNRIRDVLTKFINDNQFAGYYVENKRNARNSLKQLHRFLNSNNQFVLNECTDLSFKPNRNLRDQNTDNSTTPMMGDVTGDGSVNVQDLISIISHIMGNTTLSSAEFYRADVNCDGNINLLDIIHIINNAILTNNGLLDCPVEEVDEPRPRPPINEDLNDSVSQFIPCLTDSDCRLGVDNKELHSSLFCNMSDGVCNRRSRTTDWPDVSNYTVCDANNWGGNPADISILPPGLSCCDQINFENNPHGTCCDYSEVWDCDDTDTDLFTIDCYGALGNNSQTKALASGPCMCGSMAPKSILSNTISPNGPWGWGKCGGTADGKYCNSDSDCFGQSSTYCLDWVMTTKYDGSPTNLADFICENAAGVQQRLNGTLPPWEGGGPNAHQGSCAGGWQLLSTKAGGIRVGSPGLYISSTHRYSGQNYEDYWWNAQLPRGQFCDFGDPGYITDADEEDSIGRQVSFEIAGGYNYPHCNDYSWSGLSWPATGYDASEHPEVCGIFGCTDSSAENYNADATQDDNSCVYRGCQLYCHNNPGKGFNCQSEYSGWPNGQPCPCPFLSQTDGYPVDKATHDSNFDYDMSVRTDYNTYVTHGYQPVVTNIDDTWVATANVKDCHWCKYNGSYDGASNCNYHDNSYCNPKIYHRYYWVWIGYLDSNIQETVGDMDYLACCDYQSYRCPDDTSLPDSSNGSWRQADCGQIYDCHQIGGGTCEGLGEDDGDGWYDDCCFPSEWDTQDGQAGYCECDGGMGIPGTFDECGVCDGSNDCLGCTDFNACNYSDEATQDDGSCVYIADGECDCEGNINDCLGECNGDAVVDECGVCNGAGPVFVCWDESEVCDEAECPECTNEEDCDCPEDQVPDCLGTCGGDLVYDECGVCGGSNNTCTDNCGVINGNNWRNNDGTWNCGENNVNCDDVDCAGECHPGTPVGCDQDAQWNCGTAQVDLCNLCLWKDNYNCDDPPCVNDDWNSCFGCRNEFAMNYDPSATQHCTPGSEIETESGCSPCIWLSCHDNDTTNSNTCYDVNGNLVEMEVAPNPATGACKHFPSHVFQYGQWLEPNPTIESQCGVFELDSANDRWCNLCGCLYKCNEDGTEVGTGECCYFPQCWYYDQDEDGRGCPYNPEGGQSPLILCDSPSPSNFWTTGASLESDPSLCDCNINQRDFCGQCLNASSPDFNRFCCGGNGDAYCPGSIVEFSWVCDESPKCECDDSGGDYDEGFCTTAGQCICGRPCDEDGNLPCVENNQGYADYGSCEKSIDECGICGGNNDCVGCMDMNALNCTDHYYLCEPCLYGDFCFGYYNPNAYIEGDCGYGGCTDLASLSYSDTAVVDDGSCSYDVTLDGGCFGDSVEELTPTPLSEAPRVVPGDYVDIKIAFDSNTNPVLLQGGEVKRVEFCIETRRDVGEMAPDYPFDNYFSSYLGQTITTNPCYIDDSPTRTPRGWMSSFRYQLYNDGFTVPAGSWGSGVNFWNLAYTVKVAAFDGNNDRLPIASLEPDGSWDYETAYLIDYNYGGNFRQFNQSLNYFNRNGALIDTSYFKIPNNFNTGEPVAIAGVNQTILKGDNFILNGLMSSDPEYQHLLYRWSCSSPDQNFYDEFVSLNPTFFNNNNPVVELTSPSSVGDLNCYLRINELQNKIYDSQGDVTRWIDCDPNDWNCIKTNSIVIDTETSLPSQSPDRVSIPHIITQTHDDFGRVGSSGRRISFYDIDEEQYEFSVWLQKYNEGDATNNNVTVRFGPQGYHKTMKGCSLNINFDNETINMLGTNTNDYWLPWSGGECDQYHLYKFNDGWYKVVGRYTVNGTEDFWDIGSAQNTYYEFAVYPTLGELIPCNNDVPCVSYGGSAWCCCTDEAQCVYANEILNGDFHYCKEGGDGIGYCMDGVLTNWVDVNYDDGPTEQSVYVWGMHFNKLNQLAGVGADDSITIYVRDHDHFNIKNTKTRKPNITDKDKRLHYNKIKSKHLEKVPTSSAGRSKRSEDRLLSLGYTCEQIGGCYHQ